MSTTKIRPNQCNPTAGAGTVTNVTSNDNSLTITSGTTTPNLSIDANQLSPFAVINGAISVNNFNNTLGVYISYRDGSNVSSTKPVSVLFNSSTNGIPQLVSSTNTGGGVVVISSGSTLGVTNNVPFRLWIVLFNTMQIGVVNCLNGNNILALRDNSPASSVIDIGPFGGTGNATSAQVIYTGVNSSNGGPINVVNSGSPVSFTISNHSLVANQSVVFTTTGTLPAGLTYGTTYYVLATGLTTNTFQISATVGGTAINTSNAGSGSLAVVGCIYQKPIRILGYMEWVSGLTTAGVWTPPTTIRLFGSGQALPGDRISIYRKSYSSFASGTTRIPMDDTIPQNTEGDQYMSLNYTPTSRANMLKVNAVARGVNSASDWLITTLFRDSVANAIASSFCLVVNNSFVADVSYFDISKTTSSTTFNVRMGSNSVGTCYFNGFNGSRMLGGSLDSYIEIEEIMG